MNQLRMQEQQFDFLSKVDFRSTFEIGQFIGEVYEFAYDVQTNLDDCMEQYEIPTRFTLLTSAWDMFEDRYMHYIMNGYGGSAEDETRKEIEEGADLHDIMNVWYDYKGRAASYKLFYTENQMEKVYLNEVLRSFNTFNITYFNDTGDCGVFSNPETVKATELVNPCIKEVW